MQLWLVLPSLCSPEAPLGLGVGHGSLLAPHHEPEAQGLMMGMDKVLASVSSQKLAPISHGRAKGGSTI